MFERRLGKFCRILLLAVSMLFVGGSLQSCKDWLDDYKYDNEEPDWLGESIYAFLKKGTANCSYKNCVELIDSLGEKETLAHTGSKTLFVADDAAFARFFANNPWGVTSVKEMTKAQMRVLLYGSMLDNAMLIDMMSSTGSNATDEGQCVRRTTSLDVLDTVPVVNGESFKQHPGWPKYNQYWDIVRGNERTENLLLAMDGTDPMMIHFIGDYLKRNAISNSDISFLFQKDGVTSQQYEEEDVMIFGNKILSSDMSFGEFSDDALTIACKNGYIYRMDNVLVPPTNMAGELRAREDLRIFSHLIDRFCFPVYDEALTTKYRARYENTSDSVFRLRYFSNSFTGHASLTDVTLLESELLNYDPGMNQYSSNLGLRSDMAAMFVPKDSVLYEYFVTSAGGGKFLLERFAPEVAVPENYSKESVDILLEALDSVPQLNIAPFLNNLMKPSFVNAVASKFDRLTNDANDDMGLRKPDVVESIIANNGVIYLLNKVFAPAAYTVVTAPTLVNENMTIMRNIIKQLRYDYYLLAKDARYSLIVPDDADFRYYDPVTFEAPNTPKLYEFHYDNKRPKGKQKVEFWAQIYDVSPLDLSLKLDTSNAVVKSEGGPYSVTGTNFGSNQFMINRMTDLLDYLIIVHDNNSDKPYIHDGQMYYLTKGFGTMKIDSSNPDSIKFYGGEQIETNTFILASKVEGLQNGNTYTTVPTSENDETHLYSSMPTPPRNSIYTNMKAYAGSGDIYENFYKMCSPEEISLRDFFKTIVDKTETGLTTAEKEEAVEDSARLYSVFYTTQGEDLKTKIVNGVPFLNTYHYTVYVPSNESIDALYEEGFPTWTNVQEQLNKKNYGRAAALVRYINNFIRFHFQDNSVFYDLSAKEAATYATALLDPVTGRFYENIVKSDAGNSTIIVKDALLAAKENSGQTVADDEWAKVVNTPGKENATWNVMCRDFVYAMSGTKPNSIETSSFSVLQPIDRALKAPSMYGYDGKIVRYSKNGEKVDTMHVAGGAKGKAGLGEEDYLVAKCGKTTITLPDGTIEKNSRGRDKKLDFGYLMKPLDESKWTNVEREELVNSSSPKLITRDGFLIKLNKDNNVYEYDITNEGGKDCKQKVNNEGTVIEKVPFEDKE